MRIVLLLLAGWLAVACAPRLQPPGEMPTSPAMLANETAWQAGDGRELPLRRWPEEPIQPKAVILALHGFNDYSTAFTEAAQWWAQRGIITYAPDQRGFGRAPYTGLWPGEDRLADDLAELHGVLRQRHPGVPVYWLGESMGGAVVLHGLVQNMTVRPAGVVLVAPAVWGRSSMPLLYRATLWLASYTIPWKTFTGSGLKIQASDNIEMLRRLSRDPLFIKATRADAIHGLVNLMDEAALARPASTPLLLLYGIKDQVIPKPPVERFVETLKATPGVDMRVAVYDQGWHMLLRDLQAETVWRDIAAWIDNRQAVLSSGAERTGLPLFSEAEKKDRE
ncbi:lysophospholipase [Ferrovibrio terrae]|uniref:alpha/beta hydrolase n=1 Tax=Ferrovibrio terrae TaxID=2594003 RepID=UPI003138376A